MDFDFEIVLVIELVMVLELVIHVLAEVLDDVELDIELLIDNELDLDDFSAGERQLYAMALLWALRQISGRQLPLVIDTPLARMDEVHRSRLLLRYFPSVSDQVILFSTDTGLDARMLAQVEPHLARSYQLNYDAHRGETIVTCNNELIPQAIVEGL